MAFRRRSEHVRTAARWVVAAGLIILIVHHLNIDEFRSIVVAPRPGPLALMVGAGLLFLAMGGLNIWILLSALSPVRLSRVLRAYLVAASLGSFTPAALGDFSLVGLLGREGVPAHQSFAVMLVDRGITLALYLLVYLPLTAVLILPIGRWRWLPVAFGAGVAGVLALNVVRPLRLWVRARIVRPWLPQLEDFLRTGSDLLRAYPFHLLADVVVTVARSVVSGVMILMVLAAVGAHADLVRVVIISNVLSLLNYIPITVGGVGVYEGGAMALFGQIGLSNERVFAGFVLLRAYVVVSSLVFLALARRLVPKRQGARNEVRA